MDRLQKRLAENGGFTELELATIRATAKLMIVAIQNKLAPAPVGRVENLANILRILGE